MSGDCFCVAGPQYVCADGPCAALNLVDLDPGDITQTFALNRDHGVGDLLHHGFLHWTETTPDRMDIDERYVGSPVVGRAPSPRVTALWRRVSDCRWFRDYARPVQILNYSGKWSWPIAPERVEIYWSIQGLQDVTGNCVGCNGSGNPLHTLDFCSPVRPRDGLCPLQGSSAWRALHVACPVVQATDRPPASRPGAQDWRERVARNL